MITDVIRKEIELMNDIVSSAIFWGGDSGGAYYCCQSDKRCLIEALNEWISLRGLSEICEVSEENEVQIVFR